MLVDALGCPLRIILTPGQAHDAPLAPQLLTDIVTDQVIADRGYDSDAIIELIHTQLTAETVIPPKKNRTEPRLYDEAMYQERHLIECFINKIKHYRRVFTRFDKYAKRYLDFLFFASTLIWLR